jgi:hypothetical protein
VSRDYYYKWTDWSNRLYGRRQVRSAFTSMNRVFTPVNAYQARKRHFLSHLYIKCIVLPRQARDKHRENSKKCRFLPGGGFCAVRAGDARPNVFDDDDRARA